MRVGECIMWVGWDEIGWRTIEQSSEVETLAGREASGIGGEGDGCQDIL